MERGMSLARLCDGECANISLSAPRRTALVAAALATFQHLVRDVRRPSADWDWTAIAYVAAGVALVVCLVNMLR
jgi:hypothetical protein